jgi:hypothetical protein
VACDIIAGAERREQLCRLRFEKQHHTKDEILEMVPRVYDEGTTTMVDNSYT